MITDWQTDVRARLEAGEIITGGQIRREQGRKVCIYTFLQRLEDSEGWVFDKQWIVVPNPAPVPVCHYRLVRKKKVKPPKGTGPRTNMAVRPTDIAIQRLLAGEELEGKAIAEELGVSSSLLTYAKYRLEQQGYELVDRREGYRVFTRIKPKTRSKKSTKFGAFKL